MRRTSKARKLRPVADRRGPGPRRGETELRSSAETSASNSRWLGAANPSLNHLHMGGVLPVLSELRCICPLNQLCFTAGLLSPLFLLRSYTGRSSNWARLCSNRPCLQPPLIPEPSCPKTHPPSPASNTPLAPQFLKRFGPFVFCVPDMAAETAQRPVTLSTRATSTTRQTSAGSSATPFYIGNRRCPGRCLLLTRRFPFHDLPRRRRRRSGARASWRRPSRKLTETGPPCLAPDTGIPSKHGRNTVSCLSPS